MFYIPMPEFTIPREVVFQFHVVVGAIAFFCLYALMVMLYECLLRARLTPLTADSAKGKRVPTEAEAKALYDGLLLASALRKDGYYAHRADLMFACKQLLACKKVALTDERALFLYNQLVEDTRLELRRFYALWHCGALGKFLIIAGLAATGAAIAYFPQHTIYIALPMVVYGILGLTPVCVMLDPPKFDRFFIGFGIGGLALTLHSLSQPPTIIQHQWVIRGTNRVVHEENEYRSNVSVLAVGIGLILAAVSFCIKLVAMFVRNFLIYR